MIRRRLQAGFVDVIHSRYAGDQILTGQPVDSPPTGGGKYADTNGIVILTATGTFGTATRQITAVVSRNTLTVNAAATLPGFQADTYMQTVGNQTIDGCDWLRTDSNGGSPNGTGPMRFGSSTQPGIQQNLGITCEQNVNTVQGKSQVNGTLVSGLSAIAPDTSLRPMPRYS
jgi:hypothetical protein